MQINKIQNYNKIQNTIKIIKIKKYKIFKTILTNKFKKKQFYYNKILII